MPTFSQARQNMVENQLRPSGIDDPRVLEAMGSIGREAFLPASLRAVAYGDDDVAVDSNSFLIEPLALAKLIQTASIKPNDVVLVIGCTTGYAAAVVAKLCATVFMLATDQARGEQIDQILSEMDCDNAVVEIGPAHEGLFSQAPFDVIIIAGSVHKISDAWKNQLAEQGRLTTVIQHGGFGRVTLLCRMRDRFEQIAPMDACIPMLAGEVGGKAFSF